MVGEAENAGNRGAQPHPSPQPSRRTDLGQERGAPRAGVGWGRQSLVSFSKHVILFALHVLKVKSGACHALVDVFDVIAGCLEVCGGIIGAGTEHLETSRAQGQGESGRGPG